MQTVMSAADIRYSLNIYSASHITDVVVQVSFWRHIASTDCIIYQAFLAIMCLDTCPNYEYRQQR